MVRHRKDKVAAPINVSDPLEFLEILSPAQLTRLDETILRYHKAHEARKAYGIEQALKNLAPSEEPDELALALRNVQVRQEQIDTTIRRALLTEGRQRDKRTEQLAKQIEERDAHIQRLGHLVAEQRQEIAKLQAPDTNRASMLAQIVHTIKSAAIKKGKKLPHIAVARAVDQWLESRRRQLRDVCPPRWLKGIEKFPRLFSECIKHPTLGNKVRALISRA